MQDTIIASSFYILCIEPYDIEFYKHNDMHVAILALIHIARIFLKSVSCSSPQQSCGVFKTNKNTT